MCHLGGEANYPGLPEQQDSTYWDGKKQTSAGYQNNKIKCAWDSTYSDGKERTIPGYSNNKIRRAWDSAYSDEGDKLPRVTITSLLASYTVLLQMEPGSCCVQDF